MKIELIYYIIKDGYSNDNGKITKLSSSFTIIEVEKYLNFAFKDEKIEGPFDSLYELRKKSIFYNSIKLDKHKQRITKSKNIRKIKEYIFTPPETGYPEAFIESFNHILIGKISKKRLKGVHFIYFDNIEIIGDKRYIGSQGVYVAKIKKKNDRGEWIEKVEETSFFPDEWNIDTLFHEINFAYNNKEFISGQTYLAKTKRGVTVKFIINKERKILTVYPEISKKIKI